MVKKIGNIDTRGRSADPVVEATRGTDWRQPEKVERESQRAEGVERDGGPPEVPGSGPAVSADTAEVRLRGLREDQEGYEPEDEAEESTEDNPAVPSGEPFPSGGDQNPGEGEGDPEGSADGEQGAGDAGGDSNEADGDDDDEEQEVEWPTDEELEAMLKAQLLATATDLGVEVSAGDTKPQIIEEIKSARDS